MQGEFFKKAREIIELPTAEELKEIMGFEIRSVREFFRKLSFKGLQYGNIRGCDIDHGCDFGGDLFTFIEAKKYEGDLSLGQRLFAQNLCKKLSVPAFFIVTVWGAQRNVEYPDASQGLVYKVYTNQVLNCEYKKDEHGWLIVDDGSTTQQFVDRTVRYFAKHVSVPDRSTKGQES